MNKSGIYLIRNKISGMAYIGKAKNLNTRWKVHINTLNNHHPKTNKYLQIDWDKYNQDNFEFIILCNCRVEDLYYYEDFYINQYNCLYPNGYNIRGSSYSFAGINNKDVTISKGIL